MLTTENETTFKPFDELVCSDNFMFAKVMEDPKLCKQVLETLLDIKIERLSYPEGEKTIQVAPDAKAVRLDVHTADTHRDFDIEIQTTLYKELRLRSRYYQDMMDVDYLRKGHTYSELKENFVIFICLEDLFGQGLPIYTFENTCNEDNNVKLEDKTFKVFYNCSKWKDVTQQQKSELLKFFLTDEGDTDLCSKLKKKEQRVKMTERARKEYMDYCILADSLKEQGKQQGIAIGEKRGRSKAKLENAQNMLAMNLGTYEQIAQAVGLPLETVQQLAEELKVPVEQ